MVFSSNLQEIQVTDMHKITLQIHRYMYMDHLPHAFGTYALRHKTNGPGMFKRFQQLEMTMIITMYMYSNLSMN